MPERLKQLGLTPLKAAVVGGLLLVFAAVWGPQLGGLFGGSAAARARRAPPERRPPVARAAAQASAASESAAPATFDQPPATAIRVYTVAEAAAHDPFAAPSWSPAAARTPAASSADLAEVEVTAAALRETGVAMLLVSDGGQAAAIGDRVVRVGDEIDGFRVVEITTDGVLLQPAPASEGGDRGED